MGLDDLQRAVAGLATNPHPKGRLAKSGKGKKGKSPYRPTFRIYTIRTPDGQGDFEDEGPFCAKCGPYYGAKPKAFVEGVVGVDGPLKCVGCKGVFGTARAEKNPAPWDVEDEIADRMEDWVRVAWYKVLRAKTKMSPAEAKALRDKIAVSVRSDRSARRSGALVPTIYEPSLFRVFIYPEHGTIPDPYNGNAVKLYDKVVADLKKNPWIADAGWDSYNAALEYFYIHPRIAS